MEQLVSPPTSNGALSSSVPSLRSRYAREVIPLPPETSMWAACSQLDTFGAWLNSTESNFILVGRKAMHCHQVRFSMMVIVLVLCSQSKIPMQCACYHPSYRSATSSTTSSRSTSVTWPSSDCRLHEATTLNPTEVAAS